MPIPDDFLDEDATKKVIDGQTPLKDIISYCSECDRFFDVRSGCEADIRADERERVLTSDVTSDLKSPGYWTCTNCGKPTKDIIFEEGDSNVCRDCYDRFEENDKKAREDGDI
jgi:hypothetical protein